MPATRADRYSNVAIVLHWVIAACIVFQILLAWRMDDLKTPLGFALIQLHKSVGITILLLSLVRLGWRLANPPPREVGLNRWEATLSKITHLGFYGIMIGMPITGWIMVSASRISIPTVLFGVVPWPHVPGLAHLAEPAKSAWRAIGHEGHEWLAFGTYLLLLLHVAGALKHQVFDRESPILARMAPGAQPGRWFDPRLLMIGAGGLAVIALAELVKPPLPAQAPAPAAQPMTDDLPEAPPAAAAPAAAQAPEAATAETPKGLPLSAWSVDKGSSLAFATVWSGQAIEGQFERWSADITFSPDQLDKSKVKVSIDLTSARTGDAQRDASLAGPDWFDADAHGQAVFTATRFEKTGEDRYVAHGQLSLRGVSKVFDLPFRLKIDGDKARMSGVTSLDRTAFGVGQGEWQATDQIPAAVKVSVKLTATRK